MCAWMHGCIPHVLVKHTRANSGSQFFPSPRRSWGRTEVFRPASTCLSALSPSDWPGTWSLGPEQGSSGLGKIKSTVNPETYLGLKLNAHFL